MRRRLLAVLLVLGLLFAAIASSGLLSSPPVAVGREFKPTVSVPQGVDADRNRVDDRLDSEIAAMAANGTNMEPSNVIVMLSGDSVDAAAATFKARGGSVTTELWRYALYGFGGRIPFGLIVAFVNSRSDVLLVEREAECHAVVAYAAQQVGARPYVWSALGLRGDANSSLAVLDTGIDGSHVDFAPGYSAGDFSKKIVGWNNQVTSAATPVDDNGHGSHCSGLAAGDGFFSVDGSGYARATFGANYAGAASGTYFAGGMMVNRTGTITVSVRWSNAVNARLTGLSLYYGDKSLSTGSWSQVATVSTTNENTWYTLSYNVASVPSGGYDMYHLVASISRGTGDLFVMYTVSWPYTPPADGYSAWTGIAADSKLVGVKVLDSTGSGTSTGLVNGLNWLISNRVALHVTVASMSLGFTAEVSSVNTAIANLVSSGVCTVVAAGNSGSGSNYIFTPGSVDDALTVAAANQFDGVTSYSSQGGTRHSTMKPDVSAPGGSFYGVPLFSVDTNYNDGEGGWGDFVANDAAPMQGTSMATPVVAGAAQLVANALGGSAGWTYTRSQALLPKMLLLMTATETYPNLREPSASAYSPTLERGSKDVHEGYGRINVDAAVDAVLNQYLTGTTVVDSLGAPPMTSDISGLGEHLVWARNVQLFSGVSYSFSLNVPAGADYDLYLYDSTGTNYGEPVIVTKSTTSTLGGDESIAYTPASTKEYYLVVRRATETSGGGAFTLTSTPSQTAHLLLNADPSQASYARGQALTFQVTVFNELSPALESTLALTVTGPGGYYHYDFQPIAVAVDEVEDYGFSWAIPQAAGTYVAEVWLVPAQLTAYDAAWLKVT